MEPSEAQPDNMELYAMKINDSEFPRTKINDLEFLKTQANNSDFRQTEIAKTQPGNMLISKAQAEDLEDIFFLLEHQFEEHMIELPRETLTRAINEVLRNESLGVFYLLKEDDSSIGLAAICFVWTLEHGGKSAWLDEFYIIPEKRGNGRGTFFLRAIIDEMKREGFIAIDLEVEKGHQKAEHLYLREGFVKLNRSRWVLSL